MANTPQASKLARRWALDIRKLGGTEDDPFTRVRGINSFQPGLDPNMEDTTDFDNDGWTSQEKTMQGWSLAIGFIEKVGTEDRAQDPGQKILEEASDQFGPESMVEARWYERDGELAYGGIASVQFEPQGGSPTDLSTVNVTLQGNGARNRITHPGDEPDTTSTGDGSGNE